MRHQLENTTRRGVWPTFPAVLSLPLAAHARLEEIVVTAERRETTLQQTPISIQAFTALNYHTLTIDSEITDRISLESITSRWELERKQTIDFDDSEFTIVTDDIYDFDENFTQEFHLTGSNFDDRVTRLAVCLCA